jgi:hypothetical protein
MFRRFAFASVATVAIVWLVSPVVGDEQVAPPGGRPRPGQILPSSGLGCRHDATSAPEDRARREQAQALARAIHQAQGQAAAATQRYQPLAKLPKLPSVPVGFELRFYTDGEGYILSLKDTFDSCRYGVFTDQNGRLYEMSPQVPQIAG